MKSDTSKHSTELYGRDSVIGTALFWDDTRRKLVVGYGNFSQNIGFFFKVLDYLILGNETDILPHKVSNQLPIFSYTATEDENA